MELNIHVFYDDRDTMNAQLKKKACEKRWVIVGNEHVFLKY